MEYFLSINLVIFDKVFLFLVKKSYYSKVTAYFLLYPYPVILFQFLYILSVEKIPKLKVSKIPITSSVRVSEESELMSELYLDKIIGIF